jgi:hypothetical protein
MNYIFFKQTFVLRFLALFFSIVFILSCDSGAPKEVKEYFESGELKSHFYLKDGKKEGEFTEYLIDGSLKTKYQFENDLQSGKTVHFYRDGKLKEVQYFVAGKRENGDTVFYPDGKIQFTTDFKEDMKHGYLRKWDENGEIFFEAKYDMDKLIEVNGVNVDDGIE